MAEDASVMHRDFPRWHAAVEVGHDTERRNARWATVHAIAQAADDSMVEALVRLAFGTRQPPPPPAMSKIHEAYREADDTFDPSNATREMQVFAGATLAVLIEPSKERAAVAALSVVTASMEGGRATQLPMDLPMLAKAAIEQLADAERKRPSLGALISAEPPKFDIEASITKLKEQQNYEVLVQAFNSIANATRAALKVLATRQANATRGIDRFIQVQDEELQMLWWLIGGRSTDLDCAFDAVPADAQPLVFAKELADYTAFLPGPRSIKSLLSRAGLKERKKLSIATAIAAANPDWLTSLAGKNDPSPVTQPIHFAIKRHLEVGGGDTWVPNWAAVVGVDAARTFSALSLGTLFYRERLLASSCE